MFMIHSAIWRQLLRTLRVHCAVWRHAGILRYTIRAQQKVAHLSFFKSHLTTTRPLEMGQEQNCAIYRICHRDCYRKASLATSRNNLLRRPGGLILYGYSRRPQSCSLHHNFRHKLFPSMYVTMPEKERMHGNSVLPWKCFEAQINIIFKQNGA